MIVTQAQIGYALRLLNEAFLAAPLKTKCTIIVPLQSALKHNWSEQLQNYEQIGKVLDSSDKWHRIMHRGTKSREQIICAALRGGHLDKNPAPAVENQANADPPAPDMFNSLYCTFNLDMGAGKTLTLVDSGATLDLMTKNYAKRLKLPFQPSKTPPIIGVGGSQKTLGSVTTNMKFGGGNFSVTLDVVETLPGNISAIVGQMTLKEHYGGIRFGKRHLHVTLKEGGKECTESRLYAKEKIPKKSDNVLTNKQMTKAQKLGVLGRVLVTLGRKHASEDKSNDVADWPWSPYALVVQRIFETQTDIDPLLQDILEQESTIWNATDGLSEREYQASIDLLPGATPRMMRGYRLTPKERAELEEQIKKMISKGWIRPSSSSWGAPVLFAPKSDGGLRMCIDYRMLNLATVRNAFPLPNIQDALDGFAGASVFSTLDLAAGFHQIVLKEECRHLTAFRTDQGLYEYNVMPMGLANAPAMFQKAMNDTLRPFMNRFVTVYMDDIIIYSKNMEEHAKHLKQVLAAMTTAGYKCRRDKCCFGVASVNFLGHIVSGNGLAVDPAKVKVVNDWEPPTDVGTVRSFVGLVQYFKRFIKDLSTILSPMTNLTKKNAVFVWSEECETSFQTVKAMLSSAPVLAMPDPNSRYSVYTDASIYGCGGVLMQNDKPVAYCGRKFDKTMTNWTTTEQELYGLVHADRKSTRLNSSHLDLSRMPSSA